MSFATLSQRYLYRLTEAQTQANAILVTQPGAAGNMVRSVSLFVLVTFGALAPWCVQAQVDWSTVSGLTDSDKEAITEITVKVGMYTLPTSITEISIYSGTLFVIRTPVTVNGVHRAWRELSLCRKSQSLCSEQTNWGIGDWRVLAENSVQERWRFSDGEWTVDIELGIGISYAEAQSIVLAIHRNQLTQAPELGDFNPIFDASKITSIRTIDPIAREFQVEINNGGSGHSLFVRLKDSEVIYYGGSSWIALEPAENTLEPQRSRLG